MKKNSYHEQFEIKKLDELQAKLVALPPFCKQFFIGIEMRTSVLTRLSYACDLAIFFDFLTKNVLVGVENVSDINLEHLEQIKAEDIEQFLSYLSYYRYNGEVLRNNENAKARKLCAVRSLFKYFYNKDRLSQNVASKVSVPKIHSKPIVRLTENEVETVLDKVEANEKFDNKRQDAYNLNTRDRDIALLTLMLGTGIRVSECVGLNIEDIDLKRRAFLVTRKGGNQSELYFSEEVADALDVYIHTRNEKLDGVNAETGAPIDEPALFLSLQNKRISVRAVQNIVKKFTGIANPLKSLSPHKLRSTFGTALYRETKDIYVVAEVLGHKDINTTKTHYAAIGEDIKKDASTMVVLKKEYK